MNKNIWISLIVVIFLYGLFSTFPEYFGVVSYKKSQTSQLISLEQLKDKKIIPVPINTKPLDVADYDKRMIALANNPAPKIVYKTITEKDAKGKMVNKKVPLDPQPTPTNLWPVKTAYPLAGAILPFHRIVAYYGNLYSKNMGVLGQYPEEEMLKKLNDEVIKWTTADPTTPAIPALHYIAVVAQGSAGADGKYRSRMPSSEIDKVIAMAQKINALVFLDIQVGFSNVQAEVPLLEKYLKMPNVHLGIDPEFSMKTGIRPGKIVGTLDASDINFASAYLAKLVQDNNLPPKILIIHRYTEPMVTNYKQIKTMPEVQLLINMDGWGGKKKKIGTYKNFIYPEPVQFAGFKLFYKNDVIDPGTTLFTPEELLQLNPRPIYIQFQ